MLRLYYFEIISPRSLRTVSGITLQSFPHKRLAIRIFYPPIVVNTLVRCFPPLNGYQLKPSLTPNALSPLSWR